MTARDPRAAHMPCGAAIVNAAWVEYLRPPPRLAVTQWAERHRILSAKDSAEPGPYRASRTPYAIEPQDCLSAHSNVEEVILMWGAQTSKTTIGSNWLGYLADSNPGPVMIVQPTIDLAKRYSRQRLMPMIEESPTLRRKVRENRSRDDANTALLKEFAGGFMAIAGANSAAALRSMPVRDLFLDEIDAYPHDVDGEGDPCQLAEARQTTFARRKRLKTSTPTTKDLSRIEADYLASDACRYHVPCPHCGEPQPLDWGADQPWGLKWDRHPQTGELDRASVRYICRHHGCEIREHHKPAILAAGRWVPGRPGAAAGRIRGFQLSSLYSPLGWFSWADMADEWLTAIAASRTGDLAKLRTFVNTRLAETFEEQGDRADAHQLARRAEPYALGTVPWGGLLITQSVDVQGDRLEAKAIAWGRGEEAWVVDVQAWYGDPSIPEGQDGSLWNHLTTWRRQPLQHASGQPLRARACAIDSGGHHTQAVYAYARRHAHDHVIAIKGSSQSGRPIIGKPTDVEVNHLGHKLKRGVRLWPIGTDTAKSLIYGRLRTDTPGPGYIHFSRQLQGSYYEQLTAERLVTRYLKGRPKLEWIKPGGKRNEALDLFVYALAAAYYAGLHRYTGLQWQQLEQRLRQGDLLTPPTAPSATLAPELRAAAAADTSSGQPATEPAPPVDPAAAAPPVPPSPQLQASTATRRAPQRTPPRRSFATKW
ncbi:MAG: phage terminase large subunit family protein [Inhella sp.]